MLNTTPLIMIPTYNERENAQLLCAEILKISNSSGIKLDILFLDDNSPDGTGKILDEISAKHTNVRVIHRNEKKGVGSAHFDGIQWAYKNGYQHLVTMDCDFTHPPEMIPEILKIQADVVVGSRYLMEKSLKGWNPMRKLLTRTGHFLTDHLLGIPYDATSGFRYYRLDKIPYYAFFPVRSRGYSFFFESLFVLHFNGFKVGELPIILPPRTYGHSKMTLKEVYRSVRLLVTLSLTRLLDHERLVAVAPPQESNVERDEQGWDEYWNSDKSSGGILYNLIAAFYRKFIIRPNLNRFVRNYFQNGANVLHAGCGSGQVDQDIRDHIQITGLDISLKALEYYKRTNGDHCAILHGSIFQIPLADSSVDGIYNLGVMEHFTADEINTIMGEFHRVLRPGGRLLVFWPPEFGASVIFLKGVKWILENVFQKKGVKLHPDEITRLRSKQHAYQSFHDNGFQVLEYSFGPRDLFTYSIIAAEKPAHAQKTQQDRKQTTINSNHVPLILNGPTIS